MLQYGPTGALSEYGYKGGVFHGVHYGDFGKDSAALFALMEKEEDFLLKSPEKRRILFDLYHTDMTPEVLDRFTIHLAHIASRVTKAAFAADGATLRKLKRALNKTEPIPWKYCMFDADQDTDKTWLVNDRF